MKMLVHVCLSERVVLNFENDINSMKNYYTMIADRMPFGDGGNG
jgi:hypothetical protein